MLVEGKSARERAQSCLKSPFTFQAIMPAANLERREEKHVMGTWKMVFLLIIFSLFAHYFETSSESQLSNKSGRSRAGKVSRCPPSAS